MIQNFLDKIAMCGGLVSTRLVCRTSSLKQFKIVLYVF